MKSEKLLARLETFVGAIEVIHSGFELPESMAVQISGISQTITPRGMLTEKLRACLIENPKRILVLSTALRKAEDLPRSTLQCCVIAIVEAGIKRQTGGAQFAEELQDLAREGIIRGGVERFLNQRDMMELIWKDLDHDLEIVSRVAGRLARRLNLAPCVKFDGELERPHQAMPGMAYILGGLLHLTVRVWTSLCEYIECDPEGFRGACKREAKELVEEIGDGERHWWAAEVLSTGLDCVDRKLGGEGIIFEIWADSTEKQEALLHSLRQALLGHA